MRSYLLKASDEEMDRWREAARAAGLSLAAFLRLGADSLCGPTHQVVATALHHGTMAGLDAKAGIERVNREFRPDFKK